MKIEVRHKGDLKKAEKFLKNILVKDYESILDKYAKKGVKVLSNATPMETGETSSLWKYEIIKKNKNISIIWSNSNVIKGTNVAIILQYGHGTGTGGYVKGIDYINPALKPIFNELADAVWKEVINK